MRKQGVIACFLGFAISLGASPAFASPGEHLNWGHQLNATATACPSGSPILNVSYKIINSLDSGVGSNQYSAPWWAVIDYVLQVQVVQTGTGTFCAQVKNQGSFETVGGSGPAGSGELQAGVVGTFQGGYTENFTGTFTPAGKRTNGSIGTVDHDCDPTTLDGGCSGAGVTRWLSDYFTGVIGFDFDEWWGWVYHAGNNGSWVNKIDGNEGNITGQ